MSLPEPNFIDRDVIAITEEMVAQYELLTGRTLQPAQVERLVIDMIAYRESLTRIAIQEAAKQNLVAYARYPMLDYLGELVGVTRLPAQPARTTVRFTLVGLQTFDVSIPQGTRVKSADGKMTFSIDQAAVVAAGTLTVDVPATALAAGILGNGYINGAIKNIVDQVGLVESASNVTVSLGGIDEEDDDRLRERIKEAPEHFSNAGSVGGYRFFAASVSQEIIDVAVTSPTPGVVNVYLLTKTGSPSDDLLALVTAALNAEKVRPLTDQVNVLAPTRIPFTIAATVVVYAWADQSIVTATIQANLASYADAMRSKLGRDIVPAQILALVQSVYGVYNVSLTAPTMTVNDPFAWSDCTGISFAITGTVDG